MKKKDIKEEDATLDKIVSLAKRRGFIYQGSEIYGGLAGTWDYGPLGVALKRNIQNLWWRRFVEERDDMYGIDSAILMNAEVWKSAGHVKNFTDPIIQCLKCHNVFRADHLGFPIENMKAGISGISQTFTPPNCPSCGARDSWNAPWMFNMLFETAGGVTYSKISENVDYDSDGNASPMFPNWGDSYSERYADIADIIYLRPETAQGMFVNFKNVIDSFHPKLPFGIAQIGKAFRNEISPRDFIFRTREFEQMEIEYFIHEKDWKKYFEYWRKKIHEWMEEIGLSNKSIHEIEVGDGDRAHYSKRTIDFEFDYPFGRKELYGLAYRTDFDLGNHSRESGVELSYLDESTSEKFVPHVIEPTFGVDRTILAILSSAYTEDEMGEEKRSYLKLKFSIAPVKVAVFPLLKNKPELVSKAREVYTALKKEIPQIIFDDNGNIGKRYRRQDEIGTPYCVTVDFDTLEDNTVTLRNRDNGKQERVDISKLTSSILQAII